jgi:hypothetical protein
VKAFRVEQTFTIATGDLCEATKAWAELVEVAGDLGFISEGGALGEMKPEDVVAGSELEKHLASRNQAERDRDDTRAAA